MSSGVKDADSSKKKSDPKLKMKMMRKKEKLALLQSKRPHLSIPVPEGIKKCWERRNRTNAFRKTRRLAQRKASTIRRKKQAERIRGYNEMYQKMDLEKENKVKAARKVGNFYKPAGAAFAIVIRIRGINACSPKVRKVMELLRLIQIHNAVFIKLNKATINMLKLVQPYIAYGYPSVEMVRKLIYKRGFAKVRHRPGAVSRIPIMDTDLITQNLGKMGVETVEDIVHQIVTAGPYFRECANFLWPFKLRSPFGGYRGKKRRHFLEGGTYGNWERHIDGFLAKML